MTTHAAQQRKRLFDLLVGGAMAIVLLPVLALVALLVRARLGSPVIFRQLRPGLHGKPFALYKFRTMTDVRDHDGRLLPDRERLTSLGRSLRATSLDELPELFNVLKGDMSLVGPRPLLMHYLPYYSDRENLRHSVTPGMTGWAQVHGRNLTAWNERLAMDVWYVEHWSLGLDLRILGRTIWNVCTRAGVAVDTAEVEPDLSELRKLRSR